MKGTIYRMLLLLCLALLAAWPVSAVFADSPAPAKLDLTAPSSGSVGDRLSLKALVSSATGEPMPGVVVVFKVSTSFMNTEDSVELGRATTDKQGVAAMTYVPHSSGDLSISASLSGDVKPAVKSASSVVKILEGPQQYDSEQIGVSVPGLGPWFLAVVMGGIWFVFLWAMAQLRQIFRDGQHSAAQKRTSRLENRHV
ncbi:MAG: hypothetical protein HYX87_00990 [Chloroflexi bacterium]|nr:hypothetical protein [Chloroflexota bacterium]